MYTTEQVWGPAGRRGACSGRSKSHELARSRDRFPPSHSQARRNEPTQNNEQQVLHVLLCITTRTSTAASLQAFPSSCGSNERYFYRSVRVCVCVRSDRQGYEYMIPGRMLGTRDTNISRTAVRFQLSVFIRFALLSAAAAAVYQTVPQALYFVAPTVQLQQPHFKVFPW